MKNVFTFENDVAEYISSFVHFLLTVTVNNWYIFIKNINLRNICKKNQNLTYVTSLDIIYE